MHRAKDKAVGEGDLEEAEEREILRKLSFRQLQGNAPWSFP